jgi:hypothetical protein
LSASIESDRDGGGPLAKSYRDAWRKYRVDVCIMLFLFAAAALLTGRIWRFAYDVELFYFSNSHLTLTQKLNLGDIHSSLPLLIFTGLRQLGFSDPAIRLVPLAATGIALALIQLLTYALMEKREECPLHIRLLTIVLFALAPLALAMGDSIRWYPLFSLPVSIFATLYLAGSNKYWRLASGAFLGVAASVDFLAIFVAVPFAIYRYGLERQFRFRFDGVFWFLSGLFGSVGLWSAYGVAMHPELLKLGNAQFTNSRFNAMAQNMLGFFGGNTIGVGQGWMVIPAALITFVAGILLIDRRYRAAPVHLLLLMFCSLVVMTLGGFAEPRVFIYLAPVAVALQILFLRRQDANLVLICGAALLVVELGTAANLYHAPVPFKRESSIPHNSVIDFVKTNEKGATLVVTTDAVLADALSQGSYAGRCISMFFGNGSCFNASRHYDTVFLIYGYSSISDVRQNLYVGTARSANSREPAEKTSLLPSALTVSLDDRRVTTAQNSISAARLAQWLGSNRPASTVHFGEDADAALKSRLTHTALDPYMLTAELFSLSAPGK